MSLYKALKNSSFKIELGKGKATKFCCCFYRLMPTDQLWVCSKCHNHNILCNKLTRINKLYI